MIQVNYWELERGLGYKLCRPVQEVPNSAALFLFTVFTDEADLISDLCSSRFLSRTQMRISAQRCWLPGVYAFLITGECG